MPVRKHDVIFVYFVRYLSFHGDISNSATGPVLSPVWGVEVPLDRTGYHSDTTGRHLLSNPDFAAVTHEHFLVLNKKIPTD